VEVNFHAFHSLDTKLGAANVNVVARREIPHAPAVNQTPVFQPAARHFTASNSLIREQINLVNIIISN
jgi:hypothetical protein